ncbi:MAG: tetratricopeptide repeat protein [Myxococcales bacterium]|nr:tetratricopeptide repeat protein [Myxococcales bacterium]
MTPGRLVTMTLPPGFACRASRGLRPRTLGRRTEGTPRSGPPGALAICSGMLCRVGKLIMTSLPSVTPLLLCLSVTAHAEALWDDLGTPGLGTYQQLLDDARRHAANHNTPASERALTQATLLVPDEPAAWVSLGELRRQRRDFAGSREALERARLLAPDSSDSRLAFQLGFVRAALGDLEGSLVEYRRAEAQGGPPGVDADLLPFNLGDTYMALGRLDEAIAAYRRALALNGRRAIVHLALAVALDRDEQLAKSRSELETALAQDNDLRCLRGDDSLFIPPADRHYYHALAHLARGRLALARSSLRAFLMAVPHSPYAARARDRLSALPQGA